MKLSHSSKIHLIDLEIIKDKRNYIVKDHLTNNFFEMPKICIDAIELINQGAPLKEIEDTLKLQNPDEDVDILEFVGQLYELGLVKEIDGVAVEKQVVENHSGGKAISPKLAKFFFNKISVKLYALLFAVNLAIFVFRPDLFPTYIDFFPFEIMSINILVYMVLSFTFVVVHELGHVLSIRAHDLPTKVGVGNRLFLVVLETDMTPAWGLPPKERNTLYLAGMYFDTVVLFVALVLQMLLPGNPIIIGILGIVALDVVLRMIFQCCFFMKTDLYYIFENVTGCYNVMENGRRYLNKWLPFIKYDIHSDAFEHEEKVVKRFSYFYLAGVSLSFIMLFVFFIPQIVYGFTQIAPGFLMPLTSFYFWDAIVYVFQFAVIAGFLLYSLSRRNRLA